MAFHGIEGIYCGVDSCYDVLGAKRESTKDEITRLYRSLARKYHPDRYIQKSQDEYNAATEKFRQVANAYEILKEDDSRREYNDMLDDPEQYYRHYYRYYYRRYTGAKIGAQWVVLGTITAISFYQWFVMKTRYNEAIEYFASLQKYRFQAAEIAKQKGLLPISDKRSGRDASGSKRNRHKTKEELREQEEAIIRQIISENMDLRGGLCKPDYKKTLWIQIFLLPMFIYNYLVWHVRWFYKFNIMGEEYGAEEKIYLISSYLGVAYEQMEFSDDIDMLLKLELWKKDKFDIWKKKQDEEMREKMAGKAGFKRYKRFLKKGGPGQITFQDD